jgi:hypothetical protein
VVTEDADADEIVDPRSPSTQLEEMLPAMPTPPITSFESASQPSGDTAAGIRKSNGKWKDSVDPERSVQQPARNFQPYQSQVRLSERSWKSNRNLLIIKPNTGHV